MAKPKWAKPERQAYLLEVFRKRYPDLVSLFYSSISAMVFEGISMSRIIEWLTNQLCADLIAYWIADDREETQALRELEKRELHRLPEKGRLRGQWNTTGQSVFYDLQPSYYIEAFGVSGLTFKPFAKVRLASSRVELFVDIGQVLKGLSKSQKRKALRYGKLPQGTKEQIDQVCRLAVIHWLSR